MRSLRIYSLNFPILYHIAVLTIGITVYITFLVLMYLITGNLYLLTTFLQLLLPYPPPPITTYLISL